MKAKEYFEKYKAGLLASEDKAFVAAAQCLIYDLFTESKRIVEVRHVKSDSGFIPILKEQNDKYRAIVRMFEREYGVSPIRADGFEIILEQHFPGVVAKMKGRAPCAKVDTHTRKGLSDA